MASCRRKGARLHEAEPIDEGSMTRVEEKTIGSSFGWSDSSGASLSIAVPFPFLVDGGGVLGIQDRVDMTTISGVGSFLSGEQRW